MSPDYADQIGDLGECVTDKKTWIGVDWGTSNVRAWLVDDQDNILASATSDEGMGDIKPSEYPRVFNGLLAQLHASQENDLDVVICGMAGARQGWTEAPYLELPVALKALGKGGVTPPDVPDHLRVRILPGLSQFGGEEDVMRGEETQLLGLLSLDPDFDGLVCMPGTHSKWVQISDHTVTRFATVMTGELFALLSEHSVLRHSLAGDTEGPALEEGIAVGLEAGTSHPDRLSAALFRTRAASLLSGKGPDWCSGYLSGLLVGSEVAAHRDWLGAQPVALLGSARLCRLYAAALSKIGAHSKIIDVTAATLAGLSSARKHASS